jgi:hypothetical protein
MHEQYLIEFKSLPLAQLSTNFIKWLPYLSAKSSMGVSQTKACWCNELMLSTFRRTIHPGRFSFKGMDMGPYHQANLHEKLHHIMHRHLPRKSNVW